MNIFKFLLILISFNAFSQIRLVIRPDMIIDEKAYPQSSPFRMFDEQASVKTEPPAGKPVTSWGNFIDKNLFYPLSAIIDLGKEITVSNIYIYDVGGIAKLSFYAKGVSGWNLLFTDPLTGYESWNKHVVKTKTRYIRVVSDSPDASFPEVVMFGDQATLPPVYSALPATVYPAVENFAGINILHINDINYASIVKNIRQFHMWAWNEANTDIAGYPGYPNNKYGFNPSPGAYWNFDRVYKDYKDKALKITPVLQGSPFWLHKSTDGEVTEWKPVTGTKNTESPASYVEHADYLYQFVARYGKVAVPQSKLKLRTDNSVLTGQGSIESIENWNEPNKTWKGRKGLFTPFEFAAMTSADYDGHQSTLGTNVGVKNADPDMPFVMAGLTSLDTVYLKAMLFWFKQNRTDNKIPFNIINFHHYSNDAGGQTGSPSFGISPEADRLEKKVSDVIGFCHRNLINKPIWITEFGYDVSQATAQRAKVYSSFLGEDVQAMWLIRSYMAYCAGGADRAYSFWLQDDNSTSPYLFGTCGVISQVPPAIPVPRKSFYWLSTMSKVLGKYKYDSKAIDGNTYMYKFKHSVSSDTLVYCIWNGTANGSVRTNYEIPLSGSKAILVTPKAGMLNGQHTPLQILNGRVSLTVTENPVYIKTYGIPTGLTSETLLTLAEKTELFPNPTSGVSYLTFPENLKVNEVRVFDTKGNVVITLLPEAVSQINTISVTGLKSGVYTIKISGEGFPVLIRKLVVVR